MKKSAFRVARFFLSGFYVLVMHVALQAQNLSLTFGIPMKESPPVGSIFFNTAQKKAYNVVNGKTLTATPIVDYIQYGTASIPVKSQLLADSRKTSLEGFLAVGDKNYVFYSVSDKGQNELTVYSQELSDEMLLVGSPVRIAQFTGGNLGTKMQVVGGMFRVHTRISIRKSRSGKQMIIVFEKDEGLDIAGFSPDKGSLWSKSVSLDPELGFQLSSVVVSESGNVYVAGNYLKKKQNYLNPFLLAYSAEKKTHALHVIPSLKKVEDAGYIVRLSADETPLWVGLYYDGNIGRGGYRMQTVDPNTLELKKMAEKPFAKEYNDKLERGVYQLERYSVTDLFQMASGDFVFSIDGSTNISGSMLNGYGTLAYVVRTDKQGSEKWNATVQKYQTQPLGSSLIGHHLFHTGEKVYMIYNDNPENVDPTATEKQKETLLKNKIYVAVIEFDAAGKGNRTGLISQDKKQYSSFNISDVRYVDENQYQFLFKIGDEYKFALLQANK